MVRTAAVMLLLLTSALPIFAEAEGDISQPSALAPDPNASVDSLVSEAQGLFMEKRPLDARAKLQQALALDPKDFRPHFYLGVYYLSEVGHFPLADKYLKDAERFFKVKYGSDEDGTLRSEAWTQNGRIIQYRAEARLNLDDYAGALRLTERFERTYWDDWLPGSKAWILMKLRRVDEAIKVAQVGILRGADETRTYNILGILYSLKDNRRLALQAFKQAIKAELALGGSNQAATPLNNSGEVYRELFEDDLAEAAWNRALQLPDGCDHILPSLNLAILYIDALRLFQAERVLADFEACFAQRSERTDTEHRALLALARGKILLLQGDVEKAIPLLEQSADREQWYGKIGTNSNDLKLAAAQALSIAYDSAAEYAVDKPHRNILQKAQSTATSLGLKAQAWWQARKARQVAIVELEDFEDLFIRNTDSMLQYPLLGQVFRDLSASDTEARLLKMKERDSRAPASTFYDLYLLERKVASEKLLGVSNKTITELQELLGRIREQDKLLRARTLATSIIALESREGIFVSLDPKLASLLTRQKEELFEMLPAMLRQIGSSLPVKLRTKNPIEQELLGTVFNGGNPETRYEISASSDGGNLTLTLRDIKQGSVIATITGAEKNKAELSRSFVDKVFGYRVDADAAPVPRLELEDED